MQLRTIKQRQCEKQLTGNADERTADYRAFAEACAEEGAWLSEELAEHPGTIPTLPAVAALSLGFTPEELRAWGLL